MRILVADDETEMTDVLEALLSREHYAVDIVHDGQDALDYGLTGNYDCLVLDIMMPKLDGLQVLRALRDRGISTPVLLLTAKSQVADRIAGWTAARTTISPSPFTRQSLRPGCGSDPPGHGVHPRPALRWEHHPGPHHLRAAPRSLLHPSGQQGIPDA